MRPTTIDWSGDTHSFSHCVEVRAGVNEFGFTNHDWPLTIDFGGGAIDFLPLSAPEIAQITDDVTLSPSNTALDFWLSDDEISGEDVRGGVYDNASVIVAFANWKDVSKQQIMLNGSVSSVETNDHTAEVGIEGIKARYGNDVIQRISPEVFPFLPRPETNAFGPSDTL